MTRGGGHEPDRVRDVVRVHARDDLRRVRRPVDAQRDVAAVSHAPSTEGPEIEVPEGAMAARGADESSPRHPRVAAHAPRRGQAQGARSRRSEKPCIRSFSHRFLREMPRISAASVRLPSASARARSRYSRSNSFSAAPSGRGSGEPRQHDVARVRDVARQVLDVDVGAAGQHHRVLDRVLRAGARCPGTGTATAPSSAACDSRGAAAAGLAELLEEELHQQRQVALALAQRRDVDVEDVQPVVEVLAEQPLGDPLLEVAVGRRDDAHVDAHRFVGAERLDRRPPAARAAAWPAPAATSRPPRRAAACRRARRGSARRAS